MRVNSRKYIQRSNPRKNKYSKKIGGQGGQRNQEGQGSQERSVRQQALNAGKQMLVPGTNFQGGQFVRLNPPKEAGPGARQVLPRPPPKPAQRPAQPAQPAPAPRPPPPRPPASNTRPTLPRPISPTPVPRQIQRPASPTPRPRSPTPAPRPPSSFNETLLQMFNQDVDTIARNIKKKLGTTNERASNAARDLFNKMEKLKKEIYEKLPNNDDSYLYTKDDGYANKNIYLKEGMYQQDNGEQSTVNREPDGKLPGIEKVKKLAIKHQQETLDTKINEHLIREHLDSSKSQVLDDDGIKNVENRLVNCQVLEYRYLKKHDEVVRLFTFILNLFDKYKYQGELLLFLLKYLVRRPISPGADPNRPGPGPQSKPRIRIPRAIITNISKLIRDQDKIQDVIETMKTEIDNDNPLTRTRTDDEYKEIKDEVEKYNPSSSDEEYVEPNSNSSSEA